MSVHVSPIESTYLPTHAEPWLKIAVTIDRKDFEERCEAARVNPEHALLKLVEDIIVDNEITARDYGIDPEKVETEVSIGEVWAVDVDGATSPDSAPLSTGWLDDGCRFTYLVSTAWQPKGER